MINLFIMILFSRMPCCYPPEQHTAINMVRGAGQRDWSGLDHLFPKFFCPVTGNVHLSLSFQWQGFPFPPSMWGQRISQDSHIFLLMAKLFSKNSGSVLSFPTWLHGYSFFTLEDLWKLKFPKKAQERVPAL